MNCTQCNKEITRKLDPRIKNHFCSRSCAAIYNNAKTPKRIKKVYVCSNCYKPVSTKSTKLCKNCTQGILTKDLIHTTTVGKLKELYKDKGSLAFAAKIRGYGKTLYDKSDKPKHCIVCGYNLHYEVCHIKSISSFNDNATLAEVHDLNNMIALCPNHHWEFDRGYINLT